MMKTERDEVSIWLMLVMMMIVIMVGLGGITRITGSGLSITEWKPIMGAIPPLNQGEWEEAFSKYKLIPQFQQINSSMNLSDFKFIFFWEYFHRLVGRLIGLVVLIPGIIFIIKKKLDHGFTKKIIIGFLLGMAQGFLGWFMVSSGLSELVYVSHLRLTAHLMLALSILSYWCYIYLSWKNRFVKEVNKTQGYPLTLFSIYGVALLLTMQLSYGAIVAGLKAGYSYNTFPKMNDEWIPSQLFYLEPKWLNIFSNIATTQFIHRWLAVVLVGVSIYSLFLVIKDQTTKMVIKSGKSFLHLLLVQFILGVLTLIFHVPTLIAVLHQLNACMLVIVITKWIYSYHYTTESR